MKKPQKSIPENQRDEFIRSIIIAVEGIPETNDTYTNVEPLFKENANAFNPDLLID